MTVGSADPSPVMCKPSTVPMISAMLRPSEVGVSYGSTVWSPRNITTVSTGTNSWLAIALMMLVKGSPYNGKQKKKVLASGSELYVLIRKSTALTLVKMTSFTCDTPDCHC